MKLDVDIDDLDLIEDEEVKDILRRFTVDGFAVFKNNEVNRKISRASQPLREKKLILTSTDRRSDLHILSMNNNIFNVEKLISDGWDDIIKELR